MSHLTITFDFATDSRVNDRFVNTIEILREATEDGQQNLVFEMLVELQVALTAHVPIHARTAAAWWEFPHRTHSFHRFHDVENQQALWQELCNTVLEIEHKLHLSEAFKGQEAQAQSDENRANIGRLYYVHERKMSNLNAAIYGLIKVQDLVNRLLHESLGGDLVKTERKQWEKRDLNRESVLKGLEKKKSSSGLSQADYEKITKALKKADASASEELITYRNRLTHHVRPSVDHAMFYAHLQSRKGVEVNDAAGNVIGHQFAFGGLPIQAEYQFDDLKNALSRYMVATVEMLDDLSAVEILR